MKRLLLQVVTMFMFWLFLVPETRSQSLPFRLSDRLETERDPAKKIETLAEAANFCIDSLANLVLAKKYAWEAKDLVIRHKLESPVSLHFVVARIYDRMSTAYSGLLEIEQTFKKIPADNFQMLAQANNYYAILNLHSGKLMDAKNEYLKNLEFSEKHHLDFYYAESLRGLTETYKAIGDGEMERKYATLYLEKQVELNKKPGIAVAFFRLGELNLADSVFDESGRFYSKSFDIYKELKDTGMMAHVMLRIAWVEYLKKNLKESINLFKEALKYSEIAQNPTRTTNALGNLGTIYRDLGDDSSALIYYKKSIEISEQIRDYYNLSWVYQDMSSMFVRKGQYEQAYNYYTLYKTFNDSVETSRFRHGLEQARMLYETERKQQELQILSIRLKQHQYIFYGIAVFVALLLIIALLVIRQIRVNTRRRMAEMNQKIAEMTQKNLRQQMNPHFIFNTLNSIQYYMYQHDKIATNDYMTKFSQLMRKTLENSQHTAIPIKDELEALNLYLELEALRFKNKFIYSINIDEDIDVVMHKIPTMLIQPYVENAICHGLMNREEPGNLVIDLKLEEKTIACTILDNGIGREAAIKIRNNNSHQHHSLGTTITESRLKLVHSLYGSSMKIEYEDLKSENGIALGTKVIIHIPILA